MIFLTNELNTIKRNKKNYVEYSKIYRFFVLSIEKKNKI